MKWLQWALDNFWTVVIIGGVLLQMLQALVKKKGGNGSPEPAQPKEYEFEDPELAERTRRIREEIQRKIEQRAKGYPTEQPRPLSSETAEPPPIVREVTASAQPPLAVPRVGSRLEAQRNAEILEQQAAWEEKLREAQQMKAAAQKRAEFEAATADKAETVQVQTRSTVLADLHSPEALRRAFILREVLGPPVALRP